MRLHKDQTLDDEAQPTQAGYDLAIRPLYLAEQGWREALAEVARLKKVIADRDDELEKAHEERFAQQREIDRLKAELEELCG